MLTFFHERFHDFDAAYWLLLVVTSAAFFLGTGASCGAETARKKASSLFPQELVAKARANVQKYAWAAETRDAIVKVAEPWARMSDDELWGLMFGNTIKRSWMVLSDGCCPSCKQGVPMYNWEIDALERPWKVRCPHCKELFPKNDFHKFYLSGLDEHGVFDPKKADRSLLYNTEHPDPNDPLHMFGVDDGEGYVEGEKRWRFIGAYLIYGQWKQAVLCGIRNLAAAYTVTGDPAYAHKAGILLDRVADLYPTFDFAREGVMYDGRNICNGYVSTWHDACEETRELTTCYDQIFEAIRQDKPLADFLSGKAKQYGLENPKASFDDIQRNIEERILLDALANYLKIRSNYPRTDIAQIVIKTVLDRSGDRDEARAMMDAMLDKATAVDGVTGEKGLAGYSCFTINGVAMLLEQFARLDPAFLADVLKRHPEVRWMYRFHIDTWCLEHYYPRIGDTGCFANRTDKYVGVIFSNSYAKYPIMHDFSLAPSMYSFLWRLCEITGDADFAKVMYKSNGNSVEGIPYDLFADDPAAFRKSVSDVIAGEGADLELPSVNKEQWHLAILRSGEKENARAAWMEYDSMGGHGHANGLTLGLFAKGLDLMPDFGYKPVQYGGWGSPKAAWYGMTSAHNTVVVDGRDHPTAAGRTTLWAEGKEFHAIRASGPEIIGGRQFERTAAMVDISDRDSYFLDVFRVVGGKDHAKFMHGHFGRIATQGLSLTPAAEYGNGAQMRNFLCDPAPKSGWSADWEIKDRSEYLPEGSDVHLRYTDLTRVAQAFTAESWVSITDFESEEDEWIPSVVVRRQAADSTPSASSPQEEAPLASTFVGIIEPYEKSSNISQIRRLSLATRSGIEYPDSYAAVEVGLVAGGSDLLVSADAENPLGLAPPVKAYLQSEWDMTSDAELCMIRRDDSHQVKRIVLCKGSFARIGGIMVRSEKPIEFIEVSVENGRATVVSGDPAGVEIAVE